MATETIDDPIQQILADTTSASDAFFQEAGAIFEERSTGKAAAAPVAAPTPSASASPPAAPTAAPAKPADGSKIPAFPGAPAQAAATPTTPAAPTTPAKADPEEPSREYRPGSTQKVHWNKLWEKIDKAQELEKIAVARAELLEKQTARAASPEVEARLATIQKEKEDAIAELERVAVERSPRFEAQFKPRAEAAVNLAKSAVPFDKAERVSQLLAMPDSEYRNAALEEIAKDLTGLKAGRFASAVAEIDKIANERSIAAANSRTTFAAWKAEEAARKQSADQARLAAATTTLSQELSNFGEFFKGDAPEVKERSETAKSIFLGGLPYPDLARASAWAAIAPSLAAQNTALLSKVASLEADLGKFRAAQPGVASDAGHTGGANEPAIDENASYADSIAAMVGHQGLLR